MVAAGIDPDDGHNRVFSIPGISVFALELKEKETSEGAVHLRSLVAAAAAGTYTVMPLSLSRRPTHFNPKLMQSWCRKLEESLLQAGLLVVEVSEEGSSITDSDPVLFEEGLIVERDLRYHTSIISAEDHLLNLMYYNVFRGLSKNIRALNLEMSLMGTWEYDSPFVTGKIDTSTLAPDFQPTYLQRTVSHHPCFDIFPDSVVRDNAIAYWYVGKRPLEGRLCMALAGRHTWNEVDLALRHGCVLWGEPDVAESWEVTEGFATDWPFLIKGAVRLEAATNRYRALRGELPIFFT